MLNEFVYAVTDGARYKLSDECPIARQRDMFYEHEKHKERVLYSKHYWRSLYANKVFKSEYYVDKHMERKHADKIPPGADVCLAEYCDVLQCDRHSAYARDEKKTFPWCDRKHMADTRRACNNLLTQCFPEQHTNAKAERLNAYFSKYYCDQMTCDNVGGVFKLMSAHHETPGVGYYMALAFVLAGLFTYYACVYTWSSGKHVSSDLKRTRSLSRRTKWIELLPRGVAKRWLGVRHTRKKYS
jgi:hypothetical protein